MSQTRPDLVGEVRVRYPLPIVIPVVALLVIAVVAIGFSQVLLNVPKEAAVALALLMAMNFLGAAAVMHARPKLSKVALGELAVVVLYPVIIGVAIAQFGLGTGSAEAAHEAAPAAAAGGLSIAASNVAFSTDQLSLTAGEAATVAFDNEDTVQHNVAIYTDDTAAEALFVGEIFAGPGSRNYEVPALEAGDYFFRCDVHPTSMIGTVTVSESE